MQQKYNIMSMSVQEVMKERRKKGEDKSSDNGNKENTDKQGVNGKRDTDR